MRILAPTRRKLLVRAVFGVAVVLLSTFLVRADAATTTTSWSTVQPGTFAGEAFDACTAPSTAAMAKWRSASPYRAVGIYIGGVNRGCTQANLTAGWVKTQVTAGWHLLPLYVGPQASCTKVTSKRNLIDNTKAAAQGAAAARDAVGQARALGLAPQSVVIYDMEAYATNDADCRRGVLAFMSAWTATLHDLGYLSGFYSSMGSGGADQVANYAAPGYVRPDYLDFARWDQISTTDDPAIPATYWAPHRRMKQYRGGHKETWGGVTINIDNNLVDFAPLPSAKFADFNRNGWSDVLARTTSSGNLFAYPGNGTYVDVNARRKVSGGWAKFNAIVRVGDLNRDGTEDLVARKSSNGYLYFFPITKAGRLGKAKLLSKSFAKMREITAIGDLNRDGYPDLVAAQTSNHKLYLYPGKKGTKFGTRKVIGAGGWHTMSELAGVGDFNRDGYPDMVTRVISTGELFLYRGVKGGGLARQASLGKGVRAYRDLVGVGDFDRDGFTDLAAVQKSNGALVLFRGTGKGLRPAIRLAGGFRHRSPVL
ncbi:VCBS repeat protein [Krasilnikovia cinnamomea]|uniref:VCBS repeat protein n=1 Tax=Krasilnikovia cinnamomea TaxID=349313 RepID=A0A4Q7ZN84_9ACTN|nr:glycoside hydrolase domain-containing protein [Krasilnikovia cinnamomea]RZU51825.1 VCBS repeat protein [Krasilnikovia cinnamomea]